MNKTKIPFFYFIVLYLCSAMMAIGLSREAIHGNFAMWKIVCYSIGLIATPFLWSLFFKLFGKDLRNLKISSAVWLLSYTLFLIIIWVI